MEARDAGLRPSRLDAGHALRDPALHRARYVAATTTSASRPRWTGCNRPRWPRPSAKPREGDCIAFPWINEWKELADASGTPLGIELILPDWFYAGVLDAALVLTMRPSVFPADGRHRALAVPPGAQARRASRGRLAVRLPAPVPEVGQRRAASPDFAYDLRRWWRGNPCPVTSWASSVCRTTDIAAADLPARAAHGTGITAWTSCGRARAIRQYGVSCYQAYAYRAIRRTNRPQSQSLARVLRPL